MTRNIPIVTQRATTLHYKTHEVESVNPLMFLWFWLKTSVEYLRRDTQTQGFRLHHSPSSIMACLIQVYLNLSRTNSIWKAPMHQLNYYSFFSGLLGMHVFPDPHFDQWNISYMPQKKNFFFLCVCKIWANYMSTCMISSIYSFYHEHCIIFIPFKFLLVFFFCVYLLGDVDIPCT